MSASSYNLLLSFLFSSILIISAAVCSNGDPVLDTQGDEVLLAVTGSSYRIQNGENGLSMSSVNEKSCENFVYEAGEAFPGVPALFDTSSTVDVPIMELGVRYKFSFVTFWPNPCKKPGEWTIGSVINGNQTSFNPIIAGQDVNSNLQDSWFEVRRTEQKGVYKLAACRCQLCLNICPEVGIYTVNDRRVLGIGGEHYTVRFQKTNILAMKTAQN